MSPKQVLLTVKCYLSIYVRKKSQFSIGNVLSEENRERCIECIKKAPSVRMQSQKTDTFAAVLVPTCINAEGEISLLFTRRSGKLSRHVCQVSFPGGIKDRTDASYEDCALRETEEEIGLPRSRIQIWGVGNLIWPPRTAAIMPVFGTIENFSTTELQLNHDEVEEAFTLPLKALCSESSKRHTQFRDGYSAPVFLVDQYKVWGITGLLTHNFLSCLLPKVYNSKIQFVKRYEKL